MRAKKLAVNKKITTKQVLRDPEGGLTAAGRKHFAVKEGARLKPGVKGPADTPEKMRRKGSFLRRHYGHKPFPLVNPRGRPTRYALQAQAWGEKLPRTREDVRTLARKGTELLKQYRLSKEKTGKGSAVRKWTGTLREATGPDASPSTCRRYR